MQQQVLGDVPGDIGEEETAPVVVPRVSEQFVLQRSCSLARKPAWSEPNAVRFYDTVFAAFLVGALLETV